MIIIIFVITELGVGGSTPSNYAELSIRCAQALFYMFCGYEFKKIEHFMQHDIKVKKAGIRHQIYKNT
jgi:hypothetical protein